MLYQLQLSMSYFMVQALWHFLGKTSLGAENAGLFIYLSLCVSSMASPLLLLLVNENLSINPLTIPSRDSWHLVSFSRLSPTCPLSYRGMRIPEAEAMLAK